MKIFPNWIEVSRVLVCPGGKIGYTIGLNAAGRFAVCTGECKEKGIGHGR